MAYAWNKRLETGNAIIDSQHKELITAINELLDACSVGKGRAKIKETSNFLLDYTKRHFSAEEKLQQQSHYPDYSNHKKYHDDFVKVVNQIVAELETEGPTLVMVGKINNAIAGWLINHISTEDVKVANHIRSTSN
jgi:hemerythrin